jgi:hypothetical protein
VFSAVAFPFALIVAVMCCRRNLFLADYPSGRTVALARVHSQGMSCGFFFFFFIIIIIIIIFL